MTLTFEQKLQNYADLTIKMGLNLQVGQHLIIRAPLETAPLVRKIVATAYKAGSPLVDVLWNDDELNLSRFQYAPRDSFAEFPIWRRDAALETVKNGGALLSIKGEDPDLLSKQDPDLVSLALRTQQKHSYPIAHYTMSGATNWNIIGAPVTRWAAKIFPDHPPEVQLKKLWEIIFTICRVNQANPISAWQNHSKNLEEKSIYLTQKQYTALKYTGPGTDLTLGLPQGHVWRGGQGQTKKGINFIANIPTEEVFTLPHKDKTEGIISASKPLSYGGTLIENFTLTFDKGRVTKVTAEKGLETLEKLLETDEGAKHLGEVALVPHSSPISQSGLLFYNTLYDENATSHLAVGRAYRFCFEDGPEMSDEQFSANGGNQSLTHVDFMIGSAELDIDGITQDGSFEPVMRKGEWAF